MRVQTGVLLSLALLALLFPGVHPAVSQQVEPSPEAQGTRWFLPTVSSSMGAWWFELDTGIHPDGQANAINDQGQIVGWIGRLEGLTEGLSDQDSGGAVLWEAGRPVRLSALSTATDINNRGQVVGQGLGTNRHFHALLWDQGVVTDLGTLGGEQSWASAINELGQVVGWSDTASGDRHAFLWEHGVMIDLGTTTANLDTYAADINDHGQIVGWTGDLAVEGAGSGGFYRRAVQWQDGVISYLNTRGQSAAYSVNNQGQIVGGHISASNRWHAFLWEDGEVQDLGAFGGELAASAALSISDSGGIVGWSYFTHGPSCAALWKDGVITCTGSHSEAHGVNDQGRVVGYEITGQGVRPFLWTPR